MKQVWHPISALHGQVVTGWRGTEMALTEGPLPQDIQWEHASVPYLQLSCLDVQLESGNCFRFISWMDDGTGFFGLSLMQIDAHVDCQQPHDPHSIFRERMLPELPKGDIAMVELHQTGPNATVEAKLRIAGMELRLLAGEVDEQMDGRLAVVTPDESILVQVNQMKPGIPIR